VPELGGDDIPRRPVRIPIRPSVPRDRRCLMSREHAIPLAGIGGPAVVKASSAVIMEYLSAGAELAGAPLRIALSRPQKIFAPLRPRIERSLESSSAGCGDGDPPGGASAPLRAIEDVDLASTHSLFFEAIKVRFSGLFGPHAQLPSEPQGGCRAIKAGRFQVAQGGAISVSI